MKRLLLACLLGAPGLLFAQAEDSFLFHSSDALASRDEWGLVHQMPHNVVSDTAPHFHWRPLYYLEAGDDLVKHPAYVGALQHELRRRAYYCGEIDGIFSAEVSDAIARMQKNYSMRVTGTLTIPVRRALHLP